MPESIIITDEPDFVDGHRSFVANGSAGVEPGWYEDRAVIVKVTRVAVSGDFEKIKKVSRNGAFVVAALTLRPAIL